MKSHKLRWPVVPAIVLIVLGLAACGHNSSSDSSTGNEVDQAFARQMVAHHELAIEMAEMATARAQHPQVRTLANDIISAQQSEIAEIKALVPEAWPESQMSGMNMGSMQHGPGMSTDAKTLGMSMPQMSMSMSPGQLKSAEPFDRAFIEMMVPHHQGAIRMARVERARGSNGGLGTLADGIIAAQSRELREMNDWRSRWYGSPSPAGGIPPS